MSIQIRPWFYPASIALIGASERPGSLRAALTRHLLAGGFRGELFLLNRRQTTVQGQPAYRRLADLPIVPELAIIATPPRTVARLVLHAGRCGIRQVLIATPQDAFTAAEQATLERRWEPMRRANALHLLGPGSGLLSPSSGLHAALTPTLPPPGHLALISSSCGALAPLLAAASQHGVGFAHIAILGGSPSTLDLAILLDGLAHDAKTRVILLVLETVPDAGKFLSAARAAARLKPVLAVRLIPDADDPTSRQSDALYDAALRRAGVLRLPSLRALIDVGVLLLAPEALETPILGNRLAIVSPSRALGLLAAEALRLGGGHLAYPDPPAPKKHNTELTAPIRQRDLLDLGDAAGPEHYAAAVTALMQRPDSDAVLVCAAPQLQTDPAVIATAVLTAARQFWETRGESQPRLLLGWMNPTQTDTDSSTLDMHRFTTPEAAVQAFLHAWRRQRNRIALMATPVWLPEPPARAIAAAHQHLTQILAAGRDLLDDTETAALLETYGITLASDPIPPPFDNRCTLTVRMIEDSLFGPVLLLEPTGLLATIWPEPLALLPPLTPPLAQAGMQEWPIYPALEAVDAASPGTLDALWRLLTQTARLVTDLGEIIELEWEVMLEPVTGVTVSAARIRLAATAEPAHTRLAIQPYPRELEEQYPLPDGSCLLIRPVRAEDEPTFIDAFAQLSTEEVRMRFMYTFKELSHEEAARLTQIDYGRDMALVVFRQRPGQDSPERCGVARLMRDADPDRAEFAIILLRAATGIGLGSLLIRRLIRYARACGFRELFGEVLRENEPMLALCQAIGFHIAACPEDAGVMIARLTLW